MTKRPHATVVIPARNAADTVLEQLDALAAQTLQAPFEVVVADNGSTDGTRDVVARRARDWSALRLVDASDRRGSAHARNEGARAARADRLAFCDADDVVAPGWLEALLKPLTEETIVYGSLNVDEINEPRVRSWRGTPHAAEPGRGVFAPSGNMAMHRADYLGLGGMDEDYPKSHDVEFSFRATAAGFRLVPAPDAIVHYRYRSRLRDVLVQGYRGGHAATQLYAQFRHEPARRSLRTMMGAYWWLVSRVPFLLLPARRGLWVYALGSRIGHLHGSVRHRILYL